MNNHAANFSIMNHRGAAILTLASSLVTAIPQFDILNGESNLPSEIAGDIVAYTLFICPALVLLLLYLSDKIKRIPSWIVIVTAVLALGMATYLFTERSYIRDTYYVLKEIHQKDQDGNETIETIRYHLPYDWENHTAVTDFKADTTHPYHSFIQFLKDGPKNQVQDFIDKLPRSAEHRNVTLIHMGMMMFMVLGVYILIIRMLIGGKAEDWDVAAPDVDNEDN